MQLKDAFLAQKDILNSNNEEERTEKEFILSFDVNNSKFGIRFDKIHEVVDFFKPTEYPISKLGHVGVINLRGNVIPIIDPFEQPLSEIDLDQCKYVILETENKNLVGIVVSSAKKIEVEKQRIDDIIDDDVISFNNQPLRFMTTEAILKNFQENTDELS